MKNIQIKHGPSAGRLVSMINHYAQVYFKHEFRDFPIGHAQIFTLHHLIHNNGISQKELTRYARLDKGSIASQLHYLEKNGYIYREPSTQDARVLNIFVTKKTSLIEKKLHRIFQNWSRILLQNFDTGEEEKIISYLNKLVDNAEQKIREIKNEK
jgi:DNA-binding MarR family transcriptional regulator